MKKTAAAMVAGLISAWVGAASATESGLVTLSNLGAGGVGVLRNKNSNIALIWADGAAGWGSVITNSSCATQNVVGFDTSLQSGALMWQLAVLAFSQNKQVEVLTSDTKCVRIGDGPGLAPEVTSLRVMH